MRNEVDIDHEKEFRGRAIALGNELVTEQAAAALFNKAGPTVRSAALKGNIEAVFNMHLKKREAAQLFSLSSCQKFWGLHDTELLKKLRDKSMTLWVSHRGGWWIVIHTEEVLQLQDN